MYIALFCVGAFWTFFGLVISTNGLASAIFFKVIPFASGVFVMYAAAKLMGWL